MEKRFETLHERALELSRKYHRAESELLEILIEIDQDKIFLKLGYSSVFDYAVNALKLSEACASNFITVGRKSRIIPELRQAISNGELSVSKARKITPVLSIENSQIWIEKAKTCTKAELERAVAGVAPETLTIERAKYVTENRLELRMGVNEKTLHKLKRAQNLVSQKSRSNSSFEMTLEVLLDYYLERNDPIKRAERKIDKAIRNKDATNSRFADDAPACVQDTRYLPAKIRHQVQFRDQQRCTFVNERGKRCTNRRWLEIHHKKPFSAGGANSFDNLVTLCSSHHKYLHKH